MSGGGIRASTTVRTTSDAPPTWGEETRNAPAAASTSYRALGPMTRRTPASTSALVSRSLTRGGPAARKALRGAYQPTRSSRCDSGSRPPKSVRSRMVARRPRRTSSAALTGESTLPRPASRTSAPSAVRSASSKAARSTNAWSANGKARVSKSSRVGTGRPRSAAQSSTVDSEAPPFSRTRATSSSATTVPWRSRSTAAKWTRSTSAMSLGSRCRRKSSRPGPVSARTRPSVKKTGRWAESGRGPVAGTRCATRRRGAVPARWRSRPGRPATPRTSPRARPSAPPPRRRRSAPSRSRRPRCPRGWRAAACPPPSPPRRTAGPGGPPRTAAAPAGAPTAAAGRGR